MALYILQPTQPRTLDSLQTLATFKAASRIHENFNAADRDFELNSLKNRSNRSSIASS